MEPQNAAPKTPQDTLSSYFDDSAAAVRQTFTRYAHLLTRNTRSYNRILCQLRKKLRSSHCRPYWGPVFGASDTFCEFFDHIPNETHLILSAAAGYRYSSRYLPLSASFPSSHSCMSLHYSFPIARWFYICFLPYSIVSVATLLVALTVALCLAFAFSTSVFLLLGK
jgi:hypothetical protein